MVLTLGDCPGCLSAQSYPVRKRLCVVVYQLIRGIKRRLTFLLLVFLPVCFCIRHRLSVGLETFSGHSRSLSFHEAFITMPCSYFQISFIGCSVVGEHSRVESVLLVSPQFRALSHVSLLPPSELGCSMGGADGSGTWRKERHHCSDCRQDVRDSTCCLNKGTSFLRTFLTLHNKTRAWKCLIISDFIGCY